MTGPRSGVSRFDAVPAAFAEVLTELAPPSVALSGGGTAADCYRAVAARAADWAATSFWFGDERWVPVTDPDSNEGRARHLWLDSTRVGAVHSMVAGGPDPESAAAAYEAALRASPPLAVVHLGLGPDGHTASLFPGSRQQHEGTRWVVTAGDDAHPHPRLTLTFAALAAVGQILVTVAGVEKHEALVAVLSGREPQLPASRLVTDPALAAKTLWLVDAPAADGR